MSDDPIELSDPDVAIDEATGRLSYQGEPYSGAVTQTRPDGTWREYWSYDDGDREGDWTGWYDDNIPVAEERYIAWLAGDYDEEVD